MRVAVGVVLAALVLGAVGGWAVAREDRPDVERVSAQQPLPAADPSAPIGSTPGVLPDSDVPTLSGDTELTDAELTLGRRLTVVPVPAGWDRYDLRPGEARFTLPGAPSGGFSVRVQALPGTVSLKDMLQDRVDALPGDPNITDLQQLDPEENTAVLTATFVREGFLKLLVVRWVNFYGGTRANLEIAWTGRIRDEAGMRALMARMAAGAHPAGEAPRVSG